MGLLRAAHRLNQLLHFSNHSHGVSLAQRNILLCPSINAGTGSEQRVKGQSSLGYQFLQTLSDSATAASSCSSSEQSMLDKFEKYLAKMGLVYKNPTEKAMRFKILRDNMEYFEAFNKQPGITYALGPTIFAHLTFKERGYLYPGSRKRLRGLAACIYSASMRSAQPQHQAPMVSGEGPL